MRSFYLDCFFFLAWTVVVVVYHLVTRAHCSDLPWCLHLLIIILFEFFREFDDKPKECCRRSCRSRWSCSSSSCEGRPARRAAAGSLWTQDAWRRSCRWAGRGRRGSRSRAETGPGRSAVGSQPSQPPPPPTPAASCQRRTVRCRQRSLPGWTGTPSSSRSPGSGAGLSYPVVLIWNLAAFSSWRAHSGLIRILLLDGSQLVYLVFSRVSSRNTR